MQRFYSDGGKNMNRTTKKVLSLVLMMIMLISSVPMATMAVTTCDIVGNHDYHKGLNKYPDERFFYTFPYFLEDNNAPTIGCCELDFGNTHLYILDSNQPIFRQFEQRKWLKNRLENTETNIKKIVALHHPLRSARSKFNNLIVRWLFEEVVKQCDVELVLAGHEHTNHTLTEEETGGYKQIITNFSSKSYGDADGECGRKIVELRLEDGKIKFY